MLERLLAFFRAISETDPKCACCERKLFIGGHRCPDSVIAARELRRYVRNVRDIS